MKKTDDFFKKIEAVIDRGRAVEVILPTPIIGMMVADCEIANQTRLEYRTVSEVELTLTIKTRQSVDLRSFDVDDRIAKAKRNMALDIRRFFVGDTISELEKIHATMRHKFGDNFVEDYMPELKGEIDRLRGE